jgi:phage baseplate assembly protein W
MAAPTTTNPFQKTAPLGITIPIRGGQNGYFDQTFDTLSQVKTNIINLLNTRQGERRMQPTFGSRLWNLVFEQNVDSLPDIAENIVREDINLWIPNVSVLKVQSTLLKSDQSTTDQDIYRLQVNVAFMLNMTKQIDTVNIAVENITG